MNLKFRGGGGLNSLSENYRCGAVFPFLRLYFSEKTMVFKGLGWSESFEVEDIEECYLVLKPIRTFYFVGSNKRGRVKAVFLPVAPTEFFASSRKFLPKLKEVNFSFNFYATLGKKQKRTHLL